MSSPALLRSAAAAGLALLLLAGCGGPAAHRVDAWVSAEAVVRQFRSNEAAARSAFQSKTLGVYTAFESYSKQLSSIVVLDRLGNSWTLPATDEVKVVGFRRGDRVFLFGQVAEFQGGSVSFTDAWLDDSVHHTEADLRQPGVVLPAVDDYVRVKVSLVLTGAPKPGGAPDVVRFQVRDHKSLQVDVPLVAGYKDGDAVELVAVYVADASGGLLSALTHRRL